MFSVKRLYQVFLLICALWSLVVVLISLFSDEKFLFLPLQMSPSEVSLALRGEVLRLSVFVLFAYFSLMHVFAEKRKLSSGHILVSIMTCLTLTGAIKLVTHGNFSSDSIFVPVFGLSALIIFLGSRPKIRRYFGRRN